MSEIKTNYYQDIETFGKFAEEDFINNYNNKKVIKKIYLMLEL